MWWCRNVLIASCWNGILERNVAPPAAVVNAAPHHARRILARRSSGPAGTPPLDAGVLMPLSLRRTR